MEASQSREWAGFAVRPGRDVNELAAFPHRDLVPHALRDDERVARAEVDEAVTVCELEGERDRAGDEVEQFVPVEADDLTPQVYPSPWLDLVRCCLVMSSYGSW
jgi:hypothetical protein